MPSHQRMQPGVEVVDTSWFVTLVFRQPELRRSLGRSPAVPSHSGHGCRATTASQRLLQPCVKVSAMSGGQQIEIYTPDPLPRGIYRLGDADLIGTQQ